MKTRKSIARLLSFFMVLSLLLGISAAPVYAVGGEGETASFEIQEANGQTGTVQYKLDSGEFTVADSTPVNLGGVSSITIKAIPVADAQVNQSYSGITGTEHAVSFDYDELITESGWTYQIQDNDENITFTIAFDNYDGTFNPGGGGETASFAFEIQEANGQTGTVQYKLDNGEFTVAGSTPVDLEGVSSITIKAIPVADAQVNQSFSGITGTEQAVTFDYGALISESGWTYNIQDNDGNILFRIVFDNHDGTGGGFNPEDTYTVYFGEGSWEIGGVTVTADKTDVQYLAENDIITLENFDPETMEVRVEAEDGFRTTLAVTNGQTSISAHTNDGGVPADIAFSVVEKSSNPGGEGGEDTYTVYFGEGSWEIGGVTVTADKTDVQYLAYNDIITLENFDPETMEVRVEAEDGFWTTLAVTDGQTSISAHTNDGVVPTDIAFSVVEKSSNPGENVYYIDLGTGDWTVGDVTVSAPDGMSGVVPILDTETIPTEMLANFDPETMDITLTVSDGFVIYLEIDENGNTTLVSTRDGVELPPYGETLTFAVVAKPVDNEEFETESYTLTDDKGNVISLTYEKNRELSFTMIDYLAFSPEDLETAGIPQELYDSWMEGIANATKQHGTLLSFYEILVENDDGFLIHEGPFYIKIKMTDEMKEYDIFKIVYIDVEDNLATESPITLTQEGGYLVGTLEHLSTYALVVEKSSNPGENVYYIDLGTGSWTVGDVTVSAPEGMSGVVSLLDTETIPTEMLANFDPETMDITLTVSDGFVIYLEIDENGNTTLASTCDGVELPPYGATLTFAVVAKPGNMEIIDKTEENTCDIALEETADVLLEKLGLSDTEATRIENGENIQVWIEAEDISETVEESDKQLIESKKGNAVVAMYLNIELYKKIGNDTPSNVKQTKGAITFTIKVPDAFVNTNGTVTRTYQVIRVHNGTAEVLPCTFDAESQIISFETDQFSTYALAYIDQQNSPVTYTVFFAANGGTGTMADATGISGEYTLPANGFTAPSGKQFKAWSVGRAEKAVGDKITVTANTTVTAVWEDIPAPPSNPDNPQTGDNTHIGLLFVMLLISACGMIVLLFVAPQKKGKYQR